jgi:hypothetical protein
VARDSYRVRQLGPNGDCSERNRIPPLACSKISMLRERVPTGGVRHNKSAGRKLRTRGAEMKQANPMGEDMFEKAREAFFGTVKTSPKPSALPAEFLKPRTELTGPSSNEHEETQTGVFNTGLIPV